MFSEEMFDKVFKKILIDFNFHLPIAWVWIGVNGAFLTGRFELSKDEKKLKNIALSGNPKNLRFPVNVMLVDARGEAAHVLLKHGGEVGDLNRCRVDEPPPAIPTNWPTGCGKA